MAPAAQLPPGVSPEQVQAAFQQMQQMFQQAVQSGAMPAMVPGAPGFGRATGHAGLSFCN